MLLRGNTAQYNRGLRAPRNIPKGKAFGGSVICKGVEKARGSEKKELRLEYVLSQPKGPILSFPQVY